MLFQLTIGTLVVSFTIVLAAVFVWLAIKTLGDFRPWLAVPPLPIKYATALAAVTTWLMIALTLCVWVWALTFMALGIFTELEPALYFSVVAFTTLGFGDVTLPVPWRLLSGICAANGLLLFGLATAFLVEFLRRLTEIER